MSTKNMLIPSILALCDFFITYFPNHFFWYPYWYLGNPYQYLIGPVVPLALFGLNKLHLGISASYFGLILMSLFAGAIGLYFLVRQLKGSDQESFYSAIIFIVFPLSWLLLTVGNGMHHIGLGVLPWTFVLFNKFLQKPKLKASLLLSVITTLLILIDVSMILPLIIGFVCLTVVKKIEKKRIQYIFIKTLFIILLSLSLSTLWYTPGFWLTVFSNPSFGGMPILNLIHFVFQLSLNLLPIILAVVLIRFRKIQFSSSLLFGTLFFASFFFLTFIRFISDPDFVWDWVSYGIELQFALSIIGGHILTQKKTKLLYPILIIAVLISLFVIKSMKDPVFSAYQSRIVSLLRNNLNSDSSINIGNSVEEDPLNTSRVFLSGSPVFWIDFTLPVSQLRGAQDPYAVHPFWNHAAYQIREGEDVKLARAWLIALGTPYVLVHDKGSKDPFHDFKHPEKFSSFNLVEKKSSDSLYNVSDVHRGRIADKSILKIPKPKNGADKKTLDSYIATFKKPFAIYFDHPNQIIFGGDLKKDEVISLAITYHPSWRILEGRGTIVSDSFGNMIIVPQNSGRQKFILSFINQPIDFIIPGVISFIVFIIILFFNKLYPIFSKPLSRLSLGIHEEDEY